MRLEILTKNTGWYGSHSGYYEQLPGHLSRIHPDTGITRPVDVAWARIIGKAIALGRRLPPRNQSLTFAEELFARRFAPGRSIGHLMCFEDNAHFLERWTEAPRSLVATIHYPPAMWDGTLVRAAKRLRSAIVLYRRDIPSLEELTGKGRVRFVRHGVDLDFFSPHGTPVSPPRLAYVGQFGRNPGMFARVARDLLSECAEVHFDVVIANPAMLHPDLKAFASHPRVQLHHGVSDTKLRDIYRQATALLLPMNDSGANNAIVEAVSSGLPIATTDVGGIRDYGGGTIYPLAANDDDEGLLAIAIRYLEDQHWRAEIATELRQFALECLSWESSARAHLEAYRDLSGKN